MNREDIEVLVVDDDKNAASSYSELISIKTGLACDFEESPITALNRIYNSQIKVVVLDQKMPEMTGTDLYKKIIKINPFIKAIMLTGEAGPDEVSLALKTLKYDDYLRKKNVEDLYIKVLTAYSNYWKGIHLDKTVAVEKKLGIINPFKNLFYTKEYYLVSLEEMSTNHIFEDCWHTKLNLESTELEYSYTIEYKDEFIISSENEIGSQLNNTMGSNLLPTFKHEINQEIKNKFASSFKIESTASQTVKLSYKLQDRESKVVERKVYEYNPMYAIYRVIIRQKCSICGGEKIFIIKAYKRVPKDSTRIRIYYEDGTNSVIDTGVVSL